MGITFEDSACLEPPSSLLAAVAVLGPKNRVQVNLLNHTCPKDLDHWARAALDCMPGIGWPYWHLGLQSALTLVHANYLCM
jgi:hypothetical protein